MDLIVGREPLALIGLDASPRPLPAYADPAAGASVLVTPGEATLILPWARAEDARRDLPGARVEGPFRMITLDLKLPWDVVGFFAAVTAALADADVVIAALSSFSQDHVLVKEGDLARACAALAPLEWPPARGGGR